MKNLILILIIGSCTLTSCNFLTSWYPDLSKEPYGQYHCETCSDNEKFAISAELQMTSLYDETDSFDLVIEALRATYNINLQELIDADIEVNNIQDYLIKHNTEINLKDIHSYKPGDIIIWDNHVGIVAYRGDMDDHYYVIYKVGSEILYEDIIKTKTFKSYRLNDKVLKKMQEYVQ